MKYTSWEDFSHALGSATAEDAKAIRSLVNSVLSCGMEGFKATVKLSKKRRGVDRCVQIKVFWAGEAACPSGPYYRLIQDIRRNKTRAICTALLRGKEAGRFDCAMSWFQASQGLYSQREKGFHCVDVYPVLGQKPSRV